MKKIIIAIGLLMLTISPAFAENMGFVNMQQVFEGYKKTEVAKKDFEEKQNELKEELEEKQKEVAKAQESNKDPEDIQKLIQEIQEELQPKQEALIQLNNELMFRIRQDIESATKKVAKNYGIDIVLDKQVILHGGFDLTSYVLDELNK